MIAVTLYYREDCPECDQVRKDLSLLQEKIPHNLVAIDIKSDPVLSVSFGDSVPVVEVGPYHLRPPISLADLSVALKAASDRQEHLEKTGGQAYKAQKSRGNRVTRFDRFSYWFSKHYLAVINSIMFIYIGLTFVAPILMKLGETKGARIIYLIYSPLCHQFAFRSWFLFGEQAFYPRALVNIAGYQTYEQISGSAQVDLLIARAFVGNDFVGYKVALCQRDIAEYLAILLFGILFAITQRRFKPLKWYLWIIFGIIPIGLDGASQIPSLAQNLFPSWMIIRESTPLLRTITGGLFGFLTAWFMFPLIDIAMNETQVFLAKKLAAINQKTRPAT